MKSTLILATGIICLFILVMPSASVAQSSKPVNIALVNPIQIFSEETPIEGLRLNFIYGKNVSMTGLDLGLANHAGTGGFAGLQYGAVNICDGKCGGVQIGLVNYDQNNVDGFQWGWYNRGNYVNGFQLGLVNSAETMKGLQIGILNFIKTGSQFPVFPIVNWSF